MSRIRRGVLGLLMAVACLLVPAPAGAASSSNGTACQVSYAANQFWGGFTARLAVQNTGTVRIDGWTLRFPLSEGVEIVWTFDGELISGSGEAALGNAPYNGTVEPGGSIQVGFLATGVATGTPSSFSVNGVPCTTTTDWRS